MIISPVQRDEKSITRLLSSWFGVHGSVLCWFKSYFWSSLLRVKCDNNLSSLRTSSCDCPKALFSALYPSSCTLDLSLSTMISSLFLDHHLYAETNFVLIGLKKATCQSTQLFTWSFPLCSKSWFLVWRTSFLLWPNYISLRSLLLSHSSTSLYPALPRIIDCLYRIVV